MIRKLNLKKYEFKALPDVPQVENKNNLLNSIIKRLINMLKENLTQKFEKITSIEEVISILKTSFYYNSYDLTCLKNQKDFKRLVSQSLIEECDDLMAFEHFMVNYFLDNYKLKNLYYLIKLKRARKDIKPIYEKLDFIGMFDDIFKLQFLNSEESNDDIMWKILPLKDYNLPKECEYKLFEDCDIDYFVLKTFILKEYIDNSIKSNNESGNMLRIVKYESTLICIEFLFCCIMKKKINNNIFIKFISTNSFFTKNQAYVLSSCRSVNEITECLSFYLKDSRLDNANETSVIDIINEMYQRSLWESIEYDSDISILYAYLKLRKDDIDRILEYIEKIISANTFKKDLHFNMDADFENM